MKQPRATSRRSDVYREVQFDDHRDLKSAFFYMKSILLLNRMPNYLLHAYLEDTCRVVVGNDLCRARCRLQVFHTRHDDLRVYRTSPTRFSTITFIPIIYALCF
jgi:hypothetical protein